MVNVGRLTGSRTAFECVCEGVSRLGYLKWEKSSKCGAPLGLGVSNEKTGEGN